LTRQKRLAPVVANQDGDPLLEALRALVAGDEMRVSERVLAAQLGVTRHRLRQALITLRRSGEVAPLPEPRRAAPVRKPDEALIGRTNPIEVIELRLALEPALARYAALRATPFDIARIERAATTAANEDSGSADLAFHRMIAAAAGNALAADVYAMLREVGTDIRVRVGGGQPACPSRLRQRDSEHRAIAAAIAARDPDAAEQAMRLHLDAVQRQILGRLNPSAGAA
jgi:DNA-binding FadR family transcriptional regulator